jgi:phage tail sheath gpL-like
MTIAASQQASVNGTQTRPVSFKSSVTALESVMTLALQYDALKTGVIENELVQLITPAKTGEEFGFNSQMYIAHKSIDPSEVGGLKILGLPIAAPAAASPSTGSYDFSSTTLVTAAGNYIFYVGGIRLSIPVVKTDTATTLGDKLAAAINASNLTGTTAANVAGLVTLTCAWGGTSGDGIRLLGPWKRTDDAVPDGVNVVVTTMASGAGDESSVLQDAWDAIVLDGEWKTEVVTPTNVVAGLDIAFNSIGLPDDGSGKGTGLWADADYRPCTNWTADIRDYSTVSAISDARKSDPNNDIIAAPDYSEIPFVIAAKVAAYVAGSANTNAATKYEGALSGLQGPVVKSNDWTATLADTALKAGLTVIKLDSNGDSVLGDVASTYHPVGENYPPFQFEVNKRKTWNVAKTVKDDKVAYKNDVIVESLEEASFQPKATDLDAETARIVSLVEGWVKFGWTYNGTFTTSNMVVALNPSNPDRIDRSIPILLSGNKRVASDVILVDRNLSIANADVVVNIG